VPPKYSNGAAIAAEDASTFIVQAENIEKELRSGLDGKAPLNKIDKAMIAVELIPDGKGGGKVNVILAGDVDPVIAAEVKASLRGTVPKNYELGDVVTPLKPQGWLAPPHSPWNSRWATATIESNHGKGTADRRLPRLPSARAPHARQPLPDRLRRFGERSALAA
jgi:hypothetical protein